MTNSPDTDAASALERQVDAIAAAALACPAVAGLDRGGWQQVATYLPGRRVVGVRIEDERALVSVVMAAGASVATLEAQLRPALAPYMGGRRLDVLVADVAVNEPTATAATSPATPPGRRDGGAAAVRDDAELRR